MVPESSSSATASSFLPLSPDIPFFFAFITAVGVLLIILICVMAVCVAAASFVIFIIYVICECVCWPLFERCERDIELGRTVARRRARFVSYRAMIPGDSDSNYGNDSHLQSEEELDELPSSVEERKVLRKKVLDMLLPPVVYCGEESTPLSSKECAICLDDYLDGESCRVFPACNHVFHLHCIDHWLKNNLTCPICRQCLLDL